MRKIKFRAWDKTKGKMIFYGNIWQNSQPSRRVSTGPNRTGNLLNDIKIMQYTGLKDKNGKEIYEGDVVRNIDNKGDVECQGVVECGDTVCEWYWCGYGQINVALGFTYFECEIIGNTYENPELLEE